MSDENDQVGMHTNTAIAIIIVIAALAIFGLFFGNRLAGGEALVGEKKALLEQCARWQLRGCGPNALTAIDDELQSVGQTTLTMLCMQNFPKGTTTTMISEIDRCQDVCNNGCNPDVRPDLSMDSFEWWCKKVGDTFTITTRIWNYGTATAEKIDVYIGNGGANLASPTQISKLRPKAASQDITVSGIAALKDVHLLRLAIDKGSDGTSEGNIKESSEENNVFNAPPILCGVE